MKAWNLHDGASNVVCLFGLVVACHVDFPDVFQQGHSIELMEDEVWSNDSQARCSTDRLVGSTPSWRNSWMLVT
jgi:hypothetical protein